jgi:hypothetical protein
LSAAFSLACPKFLDFFGTKWDSDRVKAYVPEGLMPKPIERGPNSWQIKIRRKLPDGAVSNINRTFDTREEARRLAPCGESAPEPRRRGRPRKALQAV